MVVPLDGSAQARRALDPAIRVAQVLDCSIELVTVYDPVRGRWARDVEDVADQMACDQVEVAVVGSGRPGEVLTEMVAENPGTLICMATQDHDEFQRLALGSVSTHLIRATDGPILFVGPGCAPQHDLPRYRELVVCIDSSPRAETAVILAAAWAARLELSITLVHVADGAASRQRMESELSTYVDRLNDGGTTAAAAVLIADNPAHAIAEFLRSHPGALALTVFHGRGSLTRLLLGSVTSELLTRSPVPVLVA